MLEQEVMQSYNKVLGIPSKKVRSVAFWPRISTTQTSFHTNFSFVERITVDPKIHFGKPVVKDTRITVQSVLELVNDGLAFDQIIKNYYPELKEEDIRACMQYYSAPISTGEPPIST